MNNAILGIGVGFCIGVMFSAGFYLIAPKSGLGLCTLACVDHGNALATCKEILGT